MVVNGYIELYGGIYRTVRCVGGPRVGSKKGQWRCHLMRRRRCLQSSNASRYEFLGKRKDSGKREGIRDRQNEHRRLLPDWAYAFQTVETVRSSTGALTEKSRVRTASLFICGWWGGWARLEPGAGELCGGWGVAQVKWWPAASLNYVRTFKTSISKFMIMLGVVYCVRFSFAEQLSRGSSLYIP